MSCAEMVIFILIMFLLLVLLQGNEFRMLRKWMGNHVKDPVMDHDEWLASRIQDKVSEKFLALSEKVDRLENQIKEQNAHVFVASPWNKDSEEHHA